MRKKNLFNSFVNKLLQTIIWLFVRENKQQKKKKTKKVGSRIALELQTTGTLNLHL